MRRLGACVVLAVLSGCGGEETDGPPEPVAVDSSFVDVLADIGLAEARAGLAAPDRRAVVRDSLRQVALDAHGMSASALERQQERLAEDPVEIRATYDAVNRQLSGERFAPISPDASE